MGITAHWVKEGVSGNWSLGGDVIAFNGISGPHTGYNLARYLVSLCECAGILTKSSSKVRSIAFYYCSLAHVQLPSYSASLLTTQAIMTPCPPKSKHFSHVDTSIHSTPIRIVSHA